MAKRFTHPMPSAELLSPRRIHAGEYPKKCFQMAKTLPPLTEEQAAWIVSAEMLSDWPSEEDKFPVSEWWMGEKWVETINAHKDFILRMAKRIKELHLSTGQLRFLSFTAHCSAKIATSSISTSSK